MIIVKINNDKEVQVLKVSQIANTNLFGDFINCNLEFKLPYKEDQAIEDLTSSKDFFGTNDYAIIDPRDKSIIAEFNGYSFSSMNVHNEEGTNETQFCINLDKSIVEPKHDYELE